MRYGPAIIIAVALLLAPGLWFGLSHFLSEEDYQGSAVDSAARIELEGLRQQLDDLRLQLEDLRNEVARMPAGGQSFGANPDAEAEYLRQNAPNTIIDAYAEVVLIANRTEVNRGLEVASPAYLAEKLGLPREDASDSCQPMTNEALRQRLVLTQVGPIQVNMLQPAVDSLRVVFDNILRADPDLYARINTSGSLCVRAIRGTQNRFSTHSYGLAVDLNIDGHLDTFTDGRTQLGLTILADFFHAEGWVWGAGFSREDSMHFEVSRRQLDEWLAQGLL
ncbi:hypothetical protein CVM52_23870 [Pseudooceanicola lipolyticus]|uniref:Peptidase M15C domain-containing protein n=1 Tax=Pseudooceanicola lipolyticus TaxID=2029104 RepID=A0A2M8IUE6_9RHOB|nr:M15 family metallopeptidase [Pseudooceanicola lipolyticus]PJE34132.1 hypothetical protein CVM52_23870 [Pseudooceanicola lipolyticus]